MRRGTTPTITVTIGADLTDMNVHLALNAGTLIVKEDPEMSYADGVTTITAKLTQEDTLSMQSGRNCSVQVRAFNEDGSTAMASTIGTVRVDGILEEGALPNADSSGD